MQKFTVILTVTTNTSVEVSEADIRPVILELVEDFGGGTITVDSVVEN